MTRPDPTRPVSSCSQSHLVSAQKKLCVQRLACALVEACADSFNSLALFYYITSSLKRSRDFQEFFSSPPLPVPFLPHWSVYVASFACVPSLLSLRMLFCLVVFQQFRGFQGTFSNSPCVSRHFSRDFHFSHVKISCNSIVINRVLACCSGKEGRKEESVGAHGFVVNLTVQKSRRLQISLSFVKKGFWRGSSHVFQQQA